MANMIKIIYPPLPVSDKPVGEMSEFTLYNHNKG
jgi:hypothetical protein